MVKHFPYFMIFQTISPPALSKPFKVAEVYMTIDGPRTRLTEQSFETREAVDCWLEEKMVEMKK